MVTPILPWMWLISIPAPARGATILSGLSIFCQKLFQFPPLREGRPDREHAVLQERVHFNSRPCERGDLSGYIGIPIIHAISIPAPARGATVPLPENSVTC